MPRRRQVAGRLADSARRHRPRARGRVPAHPKNDVIEWMSVTVPTGFTKDTWVTSVQIKPEHPAVAHHICLGFNAHTPDVKYFEPVWQDKERDSEGSAIPGKGADIWSRYARRPFHEAWPRIAICPAIRCRLS